MTFCRFVAPCISAAKIRASASDTVQKQDQIRSQFQKTKCNLKCNRLHFYKEKQPEINKTTLISGCCLVEHKRPCANTQGSSGSHLVEAMGVEPMSEKSSVQVSPGAGDLQHSRRATPIVRLAHW